MNADQIQLGREYWILYHGSELRITVVDHGLFAPATWLCQTPDRLFVMLPADAFVRVAENEA